MEWFFGSWRFPVFVLCVLVFFELMLTAIMVTPVSDGPFGSFSRDFKIWCLGYDPATGHVQIPAVLMMLTEPVALTATIVFVWWRPLKDVLRTGRRQLLPWAAAAFVVVALAGAGLGAVGVPAQKAAAELPFPAAALRTAYTPPKFTLTDQTGAPVSLDALRGRVVMLTAVYASCGYACPMLMGQAKAAIKDLGPKERANLTVVAITLDPEHDDRAALAKMAQAQGVSAPLFRLATGDPKKVNELLDALSIARTRDPETGVIDHASVFLLVDRAGKLAYRFSMGEQQGRWLGEALRQLIREAPPAG